MENNKDFPEITVINYKDPIDKLTKVLSFIFDQFHCSPPTHGNHFEHPLDTPVEPVTSWPHYERET